MTKPRLSLVVVALITAVLNQGCDPACNDVYLTNKTSRDISASFPLDETGSHVLVPALSQVLVLKNSFRGAHQAVIEDAKTQKTLAKMDCSNATWQGTTEYITYPP
jgi:hypothetical protein